MEQIFKKGDEVFCIIFGHGIVHNVIDPSEGHRYPVHVHFKDNKLMSSYTFDGRIDENKNPTLSFTEYTLEGFSQERPEELPNKGDIVWVRGELSSWFIGHFVEKVDGRYYISRNSDGTAISWDIEMTTKNPYTNEQ